jgi:hypothetical protein
VVGNIGWIVVGTDGTATVVGPAEWFN